MDVLCHAPKHRDDVYEVSERYGGAFVPSIEGPPPDLNDGPEMIHRSIDELRGFTIVQKTEIPEIHPIGTGQFGEFPFFEVRVDSVDGSVFHDKPLLRESLYRIYFRQGL